VVGFGDPVIFDAVFGSSLSPVQIPVPLRDTHPGNAEGRMQNAEVRVEAALTQEMQKVER
jgi:hypothetical protein